MLKQRNSVDYINFMRVVAMMSVFLLHIQSYTGIRNYDSPFTFMLRTPAWAGVWIFVFISGYLMGKGFYTGRYKLESVKDYFLFMLKRFIRLAPSYYIYCFLVLVFFRSSFIENYPKAVLQIFTFTYNGTPGVNGTGVVWYVSTVMQLYLFAPIIFLIIKKIKSPVLNYVIFFAVAAAGCVLRYTLRRQGYDWYNWIYTFSPMNLDIFICGMIINRFTCGAKEDDLSPKIRKTAKIIVSVLFIGLIEANCWIYFYQLSRDEVFYKHFLPTVYILVCAVFMIAFDYERNIPNAKPTFKNICKNPLRIIDHLASISFEFYLWHTFVFYTFSSNVTIEGKYMVHYTKYTLITFAITYVLSVALHFVGGSITRLANKGLKKLQEKNANKKQEAA